MDVLQRLQRYNREVFVEAAFDETGTTGEISPTEERDLQQHFTRQELEEVRSIDDDLLKVHGRAPTVPSGSNTNYVKRNLSR